MSDTEWLVGEDDAGVRLDKFLAETSRLGSRSKAATALERGKVFVNGHEVGLDRAATRLDVGDHVRVWVDRPGTRRLRRSMGDLEIVFEDPMLVVVNKPPGLLTVPLERTPDAASVRNQLREYLKPQRRRAFVVHRIDRDTSGLVLFAKTEDAQRALKAQFLRHEPERVYWAVVYGHPDPPAGTWRDHMVWDDKALIQKETHPGDPRASLAEASYRVLDAFRSTSLIEVRLVTGKRNQIRLQARLRGHTLVGEQRYTYGPDELRPVAFPRQALHARRLAFTHPTEGRPVSFEADLPPDMARLIAGLKENR